MGRARRFTRSLPASRYRRDDQERPELGAEAIRQFDVHRTDTEAPPLATGPELCQIDHRARKETACLPVIVAEHCVSAMKEEGMNIEVSRRGLLMAAGVGAAGTALGALGFSAAEAAEAAHVRAYKLARTTETRNTCPYCSVACGVIIYSRGDLRKGEQADITHIEGDADHPTNRGTLCPKGAALKDFVHSQTRLRYPMMRKPGSDKFERVSWNDALDRVARLMKTDRDRNFVARNKDGVAVNRWTTVGFLGASATTNETAYLTYKVVRGAGILAFDNQARV
jgi:formate dehydrogenase major subunit